MKGVFPEAEYQKAMKDQKKLLDSIAEQPLITEIDLRKETCPHRVEIGSGDEVMYACDVGVWCLLESGTPCSIWDEVQGE